jgi:hypothetical protein
MQMDQMDQQRQQQAQAQQRQGIMSGIGLIAAPFTGGASLAMVR